MRGEIERRENSPQHSTILLSSSWCSLYSVGGEGGRRVITSSSANVTIARPIARDFSNENSAARITLRTLVSPHIINRTSARSRRARYRSRAIIYSTMSKPRPMIRTRGIIEISNPSWRGSRRGEHRRVPCRPTRADACVSHRAVACASRQDYYFANRYALHKNNRYATSRTGRTCSI